MKRYSINPLNDNGAVDYQSPAIYYYGDRSPVPDLIVDLATQYKWKFGVIVTERAS